MAKIARFLISFLFTAAVFPFLGITPATAQGLATTKRVSVSSDSTEANGISYSSSISGNGRFVAFTSRANNLVADDTNNAIDVFVHDLETGETTRVSVASDGSQIAGSSGSSPDVSPSLSADGRYVAFETAAGNLVNDDTNNNSDVFVHDRETGETTRVSVTSAGVPAGRDSIWPSISADGRFVAFHSDATDLIPEDTNNVTDVFLHDRQTGETTRVSVASDGSQGNSYSYEPSISADGRFIAFTSEASNLVTGDTNGNQGIFVHDRETGETTRVSVSSDGSQADVADYPAISANGRYVAFRSGAENLVDGDTNGKADIFLHDRETGQTTLVSLTSAGTQGNGPSGRFVRPDISADGRFIVFSSDSSNLDEVIADTNSARDYFVKDRETGQLSRVSIAYNGDQGNQPVGGIHGPPSISDDGRFVSFESYSTNLVPEADTNGTYDIFVRDRGELAPLEDISVAINVPHELTKNEDGWYAENRIAELEVNLRDNTTETFSGRLEITFSDSSRLIFSHGEAALEHPSKITYEIVALGAGQSKVFVRSMWAQPMSGKNITFTGKAFYDNNQLAGQGAASMTVPTAEIHPVVILPGWPGSFKNSDDEWEIDPIKGTYNNLLEELQLAGYEKDVSLFTFPYDWRRDANVNADELGQKIQGFLAQTADQGKTYIKNSQVDLVGHSGGGLVSRAYIQGSNYGDNVHRLITLGTPHQGTPKSYLAAEGLEFDFLDDIGEEVGPILAKSIIRILAWKHGYCPISPIISGVLLPCPDANIHRFIEEEAPSVRQAFPTDTYLADDPGGYLISTDEPSTIYPFGHQWNEFLTSLNSNINVLIDRLGVINAISVVGKRPDKDTDSFYRVVERSLMDISVGLWSNGKVKKEREFRLLADGDGTVPVESADLSKINEVIRSELKTQGDDGSTIIHGSMPTQLQQSIVELLTDTRPKFDAGFIDPEINKKKALMVGNLSPVEIQVTDPSGRRAGLDFLTGNELSEIPGAFFSRSNLPNEPDFIFIPDALDGDYQIKLLGIDEGDYRVVIQALGEQDVLTLAEFTGSTTPGQEHEHLAPYDAEAIPETPLSLEWFPPLENPEEPYKIAQDDILPISFRISDALREFLRDESVSVWVTDPSEPSTALASFTTDFPGSHGQSDLISIDELQEKYSVNLYLSDYNFELEKVYAVHASLFGEELGVTSFLVKPKEVNIDIWPGIKHNVILFSRKLDRPIGAVPIAILSTSDFDAPSEVDKSSLTFGKTGDEENPYYCLRRDRDYNHDGLKDLLCFFAVGNTGFQPGDTEGIVKGKTNSGISIIGHDTVKVVVIR